MTLAELFAELAKRRYFLELDQAGGLVIGGGELPPYLAAVVNLREAEITRLVGAFGGRWPRWKTDGTDNTPATDVPDQLDPATRQNQIPTDQGNARNSGGHHHSTVNDGRSKRLNRNAARGRR